MMDVDYQVGIWLQMTEVKMMTRMMGSESLSSPEMGQWRELFLDHLGVVTFWELVLHLRMMVSKPIPQEAAPARLKRLLISMCLTLFTIWFKAFVIDPFMIPIAFLVHLLPRMNQDHACKSISKFHQLKDAIMQLEWLITSNNNKPLVDNRMILILSREINNPKIVLFP